jgi:hypothetical protein
LSPVFAAIGCKQRIVDHVAHGREAHDRTTQAGAKQKAPPPSET